MSCKQQIKLTIKGLTGQTTNKITIVSIREIFPQSYTITVIRKWISQNTILGQKTYIKLYVYDK